VIEASPNSRCICLSCKNKYVLGDDELMIKYYQQYIDIVTKKGPEEMAKATERVNH
jgi:hypothetical protein